MKKYIVILGAILALSSCEKQFDTYNVNPYEISYKSLEQDNNLLGSPFPNMFIGLWGTSWEEQIAENLENDSFVRQLATPTPFVGGVNNTTYYIRWNYLWPVLYSQAMAPAQQVIRLAGDKYPVFTAWANLVKVLAAQKQTAQVGPIIYSKYGTQGSTVEYDSEKDLYNRLFADLDEINKVFKANKDYKGFARFDKSYAGNIPQWIKLVNSLRLRLAMRLVKVDPALAKTQGEKALTDDGGLIASNSDNFMVDLGGNKMPIAIFCFDWDDTRMDAAMESFLVGMKDGRIHKFFQPVADKNLVTDHPEMPYKGIRSGAFLESKAQRTGFSKINGDFSTVQKRRGFTAAEVAFLKAEAALRGWNGAGDAKANYENGVNLSFADWKADGAATLLADDKSKPIDYIDPVDKRNSFTSRSTVTAKWNDADSKELKLEKIITQKWVNNFSNTLESWVDFRRTGYPKLPFNAKNDSNADWGIIAKDDFIKRMPFDFGERNNNKPAIEKAVATMGPGAKDDIATRLWWDVPGANF